MAAEQTPGAAVSDTPIADALLALRSRPFASGDKVYTTNRERTHFGVIREEKRYKLRGKTVWHFSGDTLSTVLVEGEFAHDAFANGVLAAVLG